MTIAVIEIINQNALYKGYVSLCSHWVYSITTRIKTVIIPMSKGPWRLIEYIPLQQGLRPYREVEPVRRRLIEYIPLQQGLRLIKIFHFTFLLKAHWVYSITTRIKTFLPIFLHWKSHSHWVYSITTRIKTFPDKDISRLALPHWVYSITTRIKTKNAIAPKIIIYSLSIFHYNKD